MRLSFGHSTVINEDSRVDSGSSDEHDEFSSLLNAVTVVAPMNSFGKWTNGHDDWKVKEPR